MSERTQVCKGCGTQFTYTVRRGATRLYCTTPCRAHTGSVRGYQKVKYSKTCPCGKPMSCKATRCKACFYEWKREQEGDLGMRTHRYTLTLSASMWADLKRAAKQEDASIGRTLRTLIGDGLRYALEDDDEHKAQVAKTLLMGA